MDIIIDSSVWIDFFNYYESKEAGILQNLIENNTINTIFLCPAIYMEILRGIRDDNSYYDIKETLLNFDILDNDIMEIHDIAVNMYRKLCKKGIVVRKTNDCIIAAYAIINDIVLFHKDSDFEKMAYHSNLKIYKY